MIDHFEYKNNNGDMVDLGSKVFDLKGTPVHATVIVPESYGGRVDRFAYDKLDSTSAVDDILRANNLYNPFAFDKGEIIKLPVTSYNRYTTESEETRIQHSERWKASDKIVGGDGTGNTQTDVPIPTDTQTDDERVRVVAEINKTNIDNTRVDRLNNIKKQPNER